MPAGEFNRVLAVHNPVCSQPEKAAEVILSLRNSRWGRELEVVTTQDPATHDNVQLIRDALQPGDILLSLAGDGTANDGVNAIRGEIDDGLIGIDEVSILPFDTGSGSDLARSWYGTKAWYEIGRIGWRKQARELKDRLERRETVPVGGMVLDTTNGLDHKYVHSYIGIGFTGKAAVRINEPDFREGRRDKLIPRIADARQVLRAVRKLQAFEYESGSGQTGKAQEILLAQRPRVAGGVILVDTDPFGTETIRLELGRKHFIPSALGVVCLQRFGGGAKGETVEESLELTIGSDTHMQYDGEPYPLPSGTVVEIAQHDDLLRALV